MSTLTKCPSLNDPRWRSIKTHAFTPADFPIWIDLSQRRDGVSDPNWFGNYRMSHGYCCNPSTWSEGVRWISEKVAQTPIRIVRDSAVVQGCSHLGRCCTEARFPLWLWDCAESTWRHVGTGLRVGELLHEDFTHWLPGDVTQKPTAVPAAAPRLAQATDQWRLLGDNEYPQIGDEADWGNTDLQDSEGIWARFDSDLSAPWFEKTVGQHKLHHGQGTRIRRKVGVKSLKPDYVPIVKSDTNPPWPVEWRAMEHDELVQVGDERRETFGGTWQKVSHPISTRQWFGYDYRRRVDTSAQDAKDYQVIGNLMIGKTLLCKPFAAPANTIIISTQNSAKEVLRIQPDGTLVFADKSEAAKGFIEALHGMLEATFGIKAKDERIAHLEKVNQALSDVVEETDRHLLASRKDLESARQHNATLETANKYIRSCLEADWEVARRQRERLTKFEAQQKKWHALWHAVYAMRGLEIINRDASTPAIVTAAARAHDECSTITPSVSSPQEVK